MCVELLDAFAQEIEGQQAMLADAELTRRGLVQEIKTLNEKIAFLESREVCGAAHDNVETCGYCQRDKAYEALIRITHIGPLGVDTYPEVYRQIQKIATGALPPEAETTCVIYEHDGAYKCYTHKKMWGAVSNPDQPCSSLQRTGKSE